MSNQLPPPPPPQPQQPKQSSKRDIFANACCVRYPAITLYKIIRLDREDMLVSGFTADMLTMRAVAVYNGFLIGAIGDGSHYSAIKSSHIMN